MFKKASVLAAAVGILFSTANAQDWVPLLDEGTQEFAIAGILDIPGFEKLDYDINASYGYFIRDGWELGLKVGASDFGGSNSFDIGGFTEYNFMRDQTWVPFVGVAAGLATVDIDGTDASGDTALSDDAIIFDVTAGVKWFLNSYMAITTAIEFEVSTEEIYQADDSAEDALTRILVGMRFYF